MNDELRRHDGEADVPDEGPTTCAVTMADNGRPSELSGAPIGVPRHSTTSQCRLGMPIGAAHNDARRVRMARRRQRRARRRADEGAVASIRDGSRSKVQSAYRSVMRSTDRPASLTQVRCADTGQNHYDDDARPSGSTTEMCRNELQGSRPAGET